MASLRNLFSSSESKRNLGEVGIERGGSSLRNLLGLVTGDNNSKRVLIEGKTKNDEVKASEYFAHASTREGPTVESPLERAVLEGTMEETPRMIGDLENLSSTLYQVLQDNKSFHPQIDELASKYKSLRRSGGDGNCFYRSYLFAILERFINLDKETNKSLFTEWSHLYDVSEAATTELLHLGYSEMKIKEASQAFLQFLSNTRKESSINELLENFLENDTNLITYIRLLTSLYIQLHLDEFSIFIEAAYPSLSVKEFCKEEVEAMFAQSEQLQILACCSFFNIGVSIEYLDGLSTSLHSLSFPDNGITPCIHLLYRPGHYDVLY